MSSGIDGVEVVVFDVLGTLVDEAGGLRAAVHDALPAADPASVDELVTTWQKHLELEQQRVADGERPYASSQVLDAEAARQVADRAGLIDPAVVERLATAGQRLPPWHDSVAGLERLAQWHGVIGLSNASRTTLLRLSAHAGLRWHTALSGEMVPAYKPAPEVYRLAIDTAGAPADRVLMVAAHAWDLRAAAAQGMRTAYVHRPAEDPPTTSDAFDGCFNGLAELAIALTGR